MCFLYPSHGINTRFSSPSKVIQILKLRCATNSVSVSRTNTIPETWSNMVTIKLAITAVRLTEMLGPQLTANCAISDRCAAYPHEKRSEWRVKADCHTRILPRTTWTRYRIKFWLTEALCVTHTPLLRIASYPGCSQDYPQNGPKRRRRRQTDRLPSGQWVKVRKLHKAATISDELTICAQHPCRPASLWTLCTTIHCSRMHIAHWMQQRHISKITHFELKLRLRSKPYQHQQQQQQTTLSKQYYY